MSRLTHHHTMKLPILKGTYIKKTTKKNFVSIKGSTSVSPPKKLMQKVDFKSGEVIYIIEFRFKIRSSLAILFIFSAKMSNKEKTRNQLYWYEFESHRVNPNLTCASFCMASKPASSSSIFSTGVSI